MHTFSGSLFRQTSTKSRNALLQWVPGNCGDGLLGIRKSTRIGCKSEWGGSPLANSIAVIPSDLKWAKIKSGTKKKWNNLQQPNVGLKIVRRLLYHFRSLKKLLISNCDLNSPFILVSIQYFKKYHPKWCANKCYSLLHRFRQLTGHSKIRQFHIAIFWQQHVCRLICVD